MNRNQQVVIKEEKQKLEQLQFLRFLAFFCVYVAHAEVWLFFSFPATNCSTYAVGFFFVLSGFLAGYSSYGKEKRFGIKEYGRNLWKRICRIYPLYFITMMIPLVYSDVLFKISVMNIDGSVIQLFKNLLMIQSWFIEGSMSFNGVGWYISTLMFLSLFTLPTVCFLSKINHHPKRVLLFAGIITGVLFTTAVYCYMTRNWDVFYWHYVFPPARLGEYISGIVLGYIFCMIRSKIKFGTYEKWIFTILEAGALLLSFKSMYVFGSPWRRHILNWLIPNFVLIITFAFGRGWISSLFRLRLFVRLGDISFECFLIHNLLVIGTYLCCGYLADTYAGKIVAFVFVLTFTIILSLYLNKQRKHIH